MADLKGRAIGKMAKFLREFPKLREHLRDESGKCVVCHSAEDELHDVECPLYALEGVRMDLNLLFFNIRSAQEAADNPRAL